MLKSVPQQDLMREVLDWSDPNADSDCEQPTWVFFLQPEVSSAILVLNGFWLHNHKTTPPPFTESEIVVYFPKMQYTIS